MFFSYLEVLTERGSGLKSGFPLWEWAVWPMLPGELALNWLLAHSRLMGVGDTGGRWAPVPAR